jgi:hypothetical protein
VSKAPLNAVSARYRAHRRRLALASVRIAVTGHGTCESDQGGNRLNEQRSSRHDFS